MTVSALNTSYVIGSTAGSGWRGLDILDKIIAQDPTDRPLFELTGMGQATMVLHQWQTRILRARAISAVIEGANFTQTAVVGPDRQTNTCMILTEGVEVSNTSLQEHYWGASDIWRDQINYKSGLHGLDIEYTLINSTLTTGNTASARRMRGLREWCTSTQASVNVLTQNGATLTEAVFVQGIETGWSQGAKYDTALMGSKQQKIVDTFNGQGQTKWMDATTREIVNQIMVYHSTFGSVACHISRDLSNASTTGEIVFMKKDLVNKAWFRTTQLYPVAQTSDGKQASMVSELCLEVLNPEGLGYIYQLASPT